MRFKAHVVYMRRLEEVHGVRRCLMYNTGLNPARVPGQVINAANAGAIAVLVANNGTDGFFRMQSASASGINIPSASFPLSTARPLWNALAAGMALRAQFLNYIMPTGASSSPDKYCTRLFSDAPLMRLPSAIFLSLQQQ
jgi:hypothetical protein